MAAGPRQAAFALQDTNGAWYDTGSEVVGTTQERSVAQLIVDGYSNREIASALVVSVKTVEAHITRVYAKLDVRSRAQLKAQARNGELALTPTPQP